MEKYYRTIELIYDFSVVTAAFPAIICILRWRFFDLILKTLAIHTWRGAVISITALFFYYQGLSNRPFYYIGPCLDIVLLSLIASSILKKRNFSLLVLAICAVFVSAMCYDYFEAKTEKLINTQLTSLESLYVIVLMLILLRVVSRQVPARRYKNALIWLLSATLISNLFSLLVSLLNEVVLAYSSELLTFLWYIFSPVVIIATNGLLCYGFLLPNKVSKQD